MKSAAALRCLTLSVLLGMAISPAVAAGAWGATRKPDKSPFQSDPAFAQRITVRVTGMPLEQLLPWLTRELEVTLRPADERVGDFRVSLFVSDRPASEILDDLTAVLNMTPEGGFGWRKTRRVYELYESPGARALAAQRLRHEEETAFSNFRARVRALERDPKLRKLWEDPDSAPGLQRATQFLTSLGDAQLDQLVRDGVLVLRQPDATPGQQQMLAQLSSDVVRGVESRPEAFPGEARMYQNLDPKLTTLTLERTWQAPDLTIWARLGLGPGKGSYRDVLLPPPASLGEGVTANRADVTGRRELPPLPNRSSWVMNRPIRLKPRTWAMADVLTDLARRSGLAVISDCYTQRWGKLADMPPVPLREFLQRVDELFAVRWEEQDGILLLRSRRAAAWQAREVPERLANRWIGQTRRDRSLSLETLAEMAQLSEAQLSDLRVHPELSSVVPGFFFSVNGYKELWRIYGLLSPAQRLAVANGGVHLFGREMTPPQRREFASFLVLKARYADVPESAYPAAEFALRSGSRGDLEITLTAAGRTTSWRVWLALDRDWFTGEPKPVDVGEPESLLGKAAPPLTVRDLEGRPRTLPLPAERSFLVYFRDMWPVPYVGKTPEPDDLETLRALLTRRPELRERLAVICPREEVADLRRWATESARQLPVYTDESGRTILSYGRGPLPRAVVIDADHRVALIGMGEDELRKLDWEEFWKP